MWQFFIPPFQQNKDFTPIFLAAPPPNSVWLSNSMFSSSRRYQHPFLNPLDINHYRNTDFHTLTSTSNNSSRKKCFQTLYSSKVLDIPTGTAYLCKGLSKLRGCSLFGQQEVQSVKETFLNNFVFSGQVFQQDERHLKHFT